MSYISFSLILSSLYIYLFIKLYFHESRTYEILRIEFYFESLLSHLDQSYKIVSKVFPLENFPVKLQTPLLKKDWP